VRLGPVISGSLIFVTCGIAYITATFMIETISVANAEDQDKRADSLYALNAYKNPIVQRDVNLKDLDDKSSPFYIR
jgi:hypothetical protein